MIDDCKKTGLGAYLINEFGGELRGDVIHNLEGCFDANIRHVPKVVSKKMICKKIIEFYKRAGFTYDSSSDLISPVFYKGKNFEKTRRVVVSDFRDSDGSILISTAPLLSTG